jgi:hypothetical protein
MEKLRPPVIRAFWQRVPAAFNLSGLNIFDLTAAGSGFFNNYREREGNDS